MNAYGRMLFAALVFGCGGKSPTAPPPPTYARGTLLIGNESPRIFHVALHCCNGQTLDGAIVPGDHFCVVLNNVPSLTMDAVSWDSTGTQVDSAYVYRDSIPHAQQSPGWTWTLLLGSSEIRPVATTCA